jgi:hypothetical protein
MDLERAENGLERLRALHHEIATHRWPSGGRRRSVSLRSLPVLLLSCSPQNQVSTPWISPSSRSTRASSTPTTTTATPSTLGNKYARQEFLDKVYLHLNSPFPSKFHPNRLVTLRDQVPESALFKLPMLDANGPVLGYLQKWCQDWYNYRKGEQFFLLYRKYLAGETRGRGSGQSFPPTSPLARSSCRRLQSRQRDPRAAPPLVHNHHPHHPEGTRNSFKTKILKILSGNVGKVARERGGSVSLPFLPVLLFTSTLLYRRAGGWWRGSG